MAANPRINIAFDLLFERTDFIKFIYFENSIYVFIVWILSPKTLKRLSINDSRCLLNWKYLLVFKLFVFSQLVPHLSLYRRVAHYVALPAQDYTSITQPSLLIYFDC